MLKYFVCAKSTYSNHYKCREFDNVEETYLYCNNISEKLTILVPMSSFIPQCFKRRLLLNILQNEIRIVID